MTNYTTIHDLEMDLQGHEAALESYALDLKVYISAVFNGEIPEDRKRSVQHRIDEDIRLIRHNAEAAAELRQKLKKDYPETIAAR